jgi:tetratricopeptide (TPR) repeat protein
MRDFVHGRVHFEQGEYREALERFEAGLALWPDNGVARYLSARAAEQTGDFERAIGDYRYAIRADPAGTDARYRLVQLRLAEGDLNAARTEAVQASGRSAPDAEAELAVLRAVVDASGPEGVSPFLARLARNPAVAGRALVVVANGIAQRDGPAAAAVYIQEARGLDLSQPAFADALAALVGYLVESQAGEEARDWVAAALLAHPEAAAFQAVEAERLEKTGAANEAIRQAYERALELDPREPRALEGLARLAVAEGELAAAIDWYRRAAEADTRTPSHRRHAAALLLSTGAAGEARAELGRLLSEHPYDAEGALQLGNLLLETAEEQAAERALELGLRARRFQGGTEAEALVASARQRLAAP